MLTIPGVRPASVCSVVRDLFGNPFRKPEINPVWLQAADGTVKRLAQAIYEKGAFDRLPILADALEEGGCDDEELIGHCRSPSRHFLGCWATDALRGKTDAEPDQTEWLLRRAERSRKKSPRHPVVDPTSGSRSQESMADMTEISWTHHPWKPVEGCHVWLLGSLGCARDIATDKSL
jgi:hypothetical protein